MVTNPDIVSESLTLLELSLSIGRTSQQPVAERCEAFLRILLFRKNLSFGAVWVREAKFPQEIGTDNNTDAPGLKLVGAFPKSYVDYSHVNLDHPAMEALRRQETHLITANSENYDDHVLETKPIKGGILTFTLQDFGVLRLISNNPDSLSDRSINQLIPVIEIFALSLQSAFAQEDLQRSHEVALEARREAELERHEAERANLAKSEFLSAMSHELRTPLNAILGFGQILEQQISGPLADTQLRQVRDMLGAGKHLLTLVDDVLDLSALQSNAETMDIQEVDLSATIEDAIRQITVTAEENGIKLIFLPPDGTFPHVSADPFRLRQVLLNLLSNGIKYNREDGSVTVTCELSGEASARIFVADTGIGIPESEKGKVFEPFERLHAERRNISGSGIGLSLSQKLVEKMDGRIGFTSSENDGSTFWLELPIAETAST